MFPPMANPNLEISAAEFERLVRDWILKQGGELTSVEVKPDRAITCQLRGAGYNSRPVGHAQKSINCRFYSTSSTLPPHATNVSR
ncbi:hypothetical protein PSE10C_06890 [Pseudomonas amygdali pv. eriobotryae]|uniref:Uncharacterized protein n=1 Tax=Pseudomonas amygdali pv. eriobotryae TaxID=129137 RepID=A0A9P3EFM1_PSEA0|nr:hypothetical protein PSE10A_56500 [Pseudomonas amygdali pv. eriobotryae]GFZ69947.1 hypothetical protein PSE10C_06890 [Pseudomonas amygdali pv. eriobotryae]